MGHSFVGKRTLVTDVYPLKSQRQFVNTLGITSDLGEP